MASDPRVDAYIAGAADFARPVLTEVRELLYRTFPDLDETIKWAMPTFLYRGKNLVSMAAFKGHAAVMVHGDGRQGEALGQLGRLRGVEDLLAADELASRFKAAAARIDAQGTALRKKPARETKAPKPELPVPDDLAKALGENPQAASFFVALAPSHRREYIEWLTEARRAETRERRLLQAVDLLAQGKKRNWKYEAC